MPSVLAMRTKCRSKGRAPSRWRRGVHPMVAGVAVLVGVLAPIPSAPAAQAAPTCAPPAPGAPMLVTADCVDPRFNQPFIDIDELRTSPVPHRYVHGGFTGTDAKFSFTFPSPQQYQGRFFQATHQLFTSENTSPDNIAFAVASGGYFVQTNMGGSENPRTPEESLSPNFDTAIRGYRVNAAAAKFSRVVAAQIFGPHRTYGYLYGGSGGSYQTITSAETTIGVWDGFVPYVMGTPESIPNVFTMRVNALRVLKDKWPSIIDAIEPGGSGDPYAGLNEEQRGALEEATRAGFPPRAWFNYVPMGGGPLPLVAAFVPLLDPTYFDDFWTEPGYLGTDPASSVRAARIQHEASVVSVIAGPPRRLELSSVPTGDLTGADLVVLSGAAAGKTVPLGSVAGNTVGFGFTADPTVVNSIQAGDQVRLDNSSFLALQTYHRHQIPAPGSDFDYPDVYDYFRNADGTPRYPQRAVDVGAVGAISASGQINNGHFNGKMIVVENMLDGDAVPWQADWYRQKVEAAKGRKTDNSFRLWYTDNAQHTDPTSATQRTHVVSYQGVLQQALRDVSAWAERGVAPLASSNYEVADGQVHLPAQAGARKGIQPVVDLTANGDERAEVAVGQPVTFTARVKVPPNAGKVVAAEWDFEGAGTYAVAAQIGDPRPGTVEVTATYTFSQPGTYFTALRATSQREGDPTTPHARVQNLDRVRVVVH